METSFSSYTDRLCFTKVYKTFSFTAYKHRYVNTTCHIRHQALYTYLISASCATYLPWSTVGRFSCTSKGSMPSGAMFLGPV